MRALPAADLPGEPRLGLPGIRLVFLKLATSRRNTTGSADNACAFHGGCQAVTRRGLE